MDFYKSLNEAENPGRSENMIPLEGKDHFYPDPMTLQNQGPDVKIF